MEKVKESQKNINRPKINKKERSKSETTGFKKFYFSQKLVTRSSFCGHKFFANFLARPLNFPQAMPFTCLSSYFPWLLLLCSKVKKKYQRNKRKKSKNPKKILIDQK